MKNLVELDDQETDLVMCALRYYEANHFSANEADDLVQRINCPDKPARPWEIQRAHENGVAVEMRYWLADFETPWGELIKGEKLNWDLNVYRIKGKKPTPMKKWEIQKAFEEGAAVEYILLANDMNPTVGRSWHIFQFGQLNWALYDYRVMS